MPEMPEVETVARELRASGICNQVLLDLKIHSPHLCRPQNPQDLVHQLIGTRLLSISRLGKVLCWQFERAMLAVHLRMTGQFAFASDQGKKHVHASLNFYGCEELWFIDQRKFGRFWLIESLQELNLGPEGWDESLTPDWLYATLRPRKSCVKAVLLNQQAIAGVGNIYADESLFFAGILPFRAASSITLDECARLLQGIRFTMRLGLENLGTTLGSAAANFYSVNGRAGHNQNSLRVFRRDGLPCLVCGTKVQKSKVAQRGTHFCPNCQK